MTILSGRQQKSFTGLNELLKQSPTLLTVTPRNIAFENAILSDAATLSRRAYLAAQTGDLPAASRLIKVSFVQSKNLTRGGGPWVAFVSNYAASLAFVFYRLGMFPKATLALDESNLADLVLMRHWGLVQMHLHRVQLAQNLARVEYEIGNKHMAIRLLKQLELHLSGRDLDQCPLPGPWKGSLCSASELGVRQQMTARTKRLIKELEERLSQ